MNKNLKGVLFFLFVFSFFKGEAQFYSTGQDAAKLKWKQINTEHFQLIYPEEFSFKAQHIANTLDYYYNLAGSSLKHKPKKISVILHNQAIVSNGYVAWAPKRMELYTTPSQDAYPEFWLDHLCIHEQRHVVQIDKLNKGFTKILSLVFGQQGTALVAGQLPYWFLEGDAVAAETAFSKFGRGRLPNFQKGIKANLLGEEERFSFDQTLFGSYKRYTPNRYELGYQLSTYGRIKYGNYLWSDVVDHVAKHSYTLLPTHFSFYRGLKKNSGVSQSGLYTQTMDYLEQKWEDEAKELKPINVKEFSEIITNNHCDYLNPKWLSDEEVIALKKSYSHNPQFVLLSKESEKVIFEPGILLDDAFSFSNNILVWAEYQPDIRWQNRQFNRIKAYNIRTGKQATIVEKSRYFSPSISNNGQKIAVVEVDHQNKSSLVVLNTFNGEIVHKIDSKNHLTRPMWLDNDSEIFAVEITQDGKQIVSYNLQYRNWKVVYKAGKSDIQRIIPTNSNLYFHATYNGTDNIYVYDYNTEETYQLSNSKYGITDFDLDNTNKNLYVSDYTEYGSRIGIIPIERASWRKLDENEIYVFEFAEKLTKKEKSNIDSVSRNQIDFKEKPYRKALNLFNFHSWVPFSIDIDKANLANASGLLSNLEQSLNPGIMLLSQNKLSTVESIVSYAYKNGNHVVSSSVELKGQYPVLRFSASYGEQQMIYRTSSAYWQPESDLGFKYQADIYIPFNLSKGKYIKGFIPLVSIEYDENLRYNYLNDYYIKGIEIVQTQLLYYAYERKAAKDIIPKSGVVFQMNLYNTPFESELYNYIFNVNSLFYLPARNNRGFQVDFGYQYQDPKLFLFGSTFNFPRGTLLRRTEKMTKLYSDFVFPIAYPEINLGSLFYLKRLRGGLFADYAYNSYRVVNPNTGGLYWYSENIFSAGLELKADYHLLRTIFPLTTGLRFGYSPTESRMVFNVLFGVDLSGF